MEVIDIRLSWVVRLGWALFGAAALLLSACGEDDDTGFGLINEGTLSVCTAAPYEPFEFEEDGAFTGFDMELLREVATRLDLEMEVAVQPVDGIWLAPAAGTCDIVASAMTITDTRQQEALFSDPYFDADQSLLVRTADEETFAALADLAGTSIAVQTGTTGEEYAQEHAPDDAELKAFDDVGPMFLALESGDVDAVLQDFAVNAFRAAQDDGFVVSATVPADEQYGFATSQDNTELIDAVNEQLAEIRRDGTYDQIFEDWFGEQSQSNA